jgi:hypothetical protein
MNSFGPLTTENVAIKPINATRPFRQCCLNVSSGRLLKRNKKSALKHPQKRAFLAAYAELGNVTRAAAIAGITRESHYDWKAADRIYAAEFERARERAGDALEDECRRRACEGWDQPVFHQGKVRPEHRSLAALDNTSCLLPPVLTHRRSCDR